MTKEEIAHHEQFLLLTQFLQKLSAAGASKSFCVWESTIQQEKGKLNPLTIHLLAVASSNKVVHCFSKTKKNGFSDKSSSYLDIIYPYNAVGH